MDITVNIQSYNTFGGSRLYSPIGDLLICNTGEYGPAVQSLDITVCLPSRTRQFLPTLEENFDRFHTYLGKLPKVTFRRGKNRVEIIWRSHRLFAEDNLGPWPSPDLLKLAAADVSEAVGMLKKKIKATDQFDLERFLADATTSVNKPVDTMEAWTEIRDRAKAIRLAAPESGNPWDQLDIDWSLYHPKAREILNDPFFWDCADDTAPHGNDTGSDLLEDYLRWSKRNKAGSPLTFLERLLKGWNIKQMDWAIVDPDETRKNYQKDSIALSVCNESIIALAFATLKTKAECPPELIRMALAGLTRTAILVKGSGLKEETKAEWFQSIEKMNRKLASLLSDD